MKTLTRFILYVLIFSISLTSYVYGADYQVNLYINSKKINCDVAPEIVNGRTLVPLRAFFEEVDAHVFWNGAINQITVATDDKTIVLTVNSNTALINSKRYILDTPPVIKDDRTLIPVRFISENLGYKVDWVDKTKSVYISEIPKENEMKDDTQNIKYSISSIKRTVSDVNESIVIKTDCTNEPGFMILTTPYRIVMDFENTVLKNGDGKIKANSPYIKEIRYAKHDNDSRIVIECNGTQPYTKSFNKSEITIVVGNEDSKILETDKILDNNIDDENYLSEIEDITSSDDMTDDDNISALEFLAKRNPDDLLVVIDAGHGGKDPGALGVDEDGNILIREKDVNLTIANKTAKILKNRGINVKQTRSSDVYLPLENISSYANSIDADIFVSIHNNAVEDTSVSGMMVLYNGNGVKSKYGIDGKTIATYIRKEISQNVEIKDHGIVSRPGLWVLRKTFMPAVLVECAFVTNEYDRSLLFDNSVLDAFAKSIADGIENSLKTVKDNIIQARKTLELSDVK